MQLASEVFWIPSPLQVHIFCEDVELPTSPLLLDVQPDPDVGSVVVEEEEQQKQLPEQLAEQQQLKARPPSPMADYEGAPPPHLGHISFSGLSAPCSLGSIVEVAVSAGFYYYDQWVMGFEL